MMPTNEQIAELLENMAFLLEIKEDAVFKIRAYQRAARTIEQLSLPLAQSFDKEERFDKRSSITAWEKINTLDC